FMTDDYYHFNESSMSLVGERTGKVYNIGDKVTVKVAGVNLEEHKVDFEFVDMDKPEQPQSESQCIHSKQKKEKVRLQGKDNGHKDRGKRKRKNKGGRRTD